MNASELILILGVAAIVAFAGTWIVRKQRAADVAAWKKRQNDLYESAVADMDTEIRSELQKEPIQPTETTRGK